MVTITKSTKSLKIKDIKRNWHLVDLKGKILGRAATEIAAFLQGKHKRDNVPYIDCGDFVVVVNSNNTQYFVFYSPEKLNVLGWVLTLLIIFFGKRIVSN